MLPWDVRRLKQLQEMDCYTEEHHLFGSAFIIYYNIKAALYLTVIVFVKNLNTFQIMRTKYVRGKETESIKTT